MRPYPAILLGLLASPLCLSLFSARAPAVAPTIPPGGSTAGQGDRSPAATGKKSPVDPAHPSADAAPPAPAEAPGSVAPEPAAPGSGVPGSAAAPGVNSGGDLPGASGSADKAPPIPTPLSARSTERITLPVCTIYTDDLPAGVIRTERTVHTEAHGDRTVITTEVTRYRRPYHPLPESWIVIPALRLRLRLVEGVSQRAMSHGPGHFPGMALPGEIGNCGIAAHSNVPACDYFHALHRLRPGDSVYLETPNDTFRYAVTNLHVVRPSNTSDLLPTPYRRLTLVTCTLPDARNRLIVEAVSNGAEQDSLGGTVPTRFHMPEAGSPARRPRGNVRRTYHLHSRRTRGSGSRR